MTSSEGLVVVDELSGMADIREIPFLLGCVDLCVDE